MPRKKPSSTRIQPLHESSVPPPPSAKNHNLQMILFVLTAFFLFRTAQIWGGLEDRPQPKEKLSQAAQNALNEKWSDFAYADWNDGQLGASLLVMASLCYSATGWKKDKAKMGLAAALALSVNAVLGDKTVFTVVELVLAAASIWGSMAYEVRDHERDRCTGRQVALARTVSLVGGGLLIFLEFIRMGVANPWENLDEPIDKSDAVNPRLHQAARAGIAFIFITNMFSNDVHAVRGVLKCGVFASAALVMPCLGTYAGFTTYIIIAAGTTLCLANLFCLTLKPVSLPFEKAIAGMKKTLMGSTVDGFGE